MQSDTALKIALFLIIFNLSLPLINTLGIWSTVPAGMENPLFISLDWKTLVYAGVGLFTLVTAVVFQMPIGAAVFAGVFFATGVFFSSTLTLMMSPFSVGEAAALMDAVQTIITVGINGIFLFVFMELSR